MMLVKEVTNINDRSYLREKRTTNNVFVDERNKEERKNFIRILEENGYSLDKDETRSIDTIIDWVLPIEIALKNKEYRMMGNITCAAAAVTQRLLISKEEFYQKYM